MVTFWLLGTQSQLIRLLLLTVVNVKVFFSLFIRDFVKIITNLEQCNKCMRNSFQVNENCKLTKLERELSGQLQITDFTNFVMRGCVVNTANVAFRKVFYLVLIRYTYTYCCWYDFYGNDGIEFSIDIY